MIELPEAIVLSNQMNEMLNGKVIKELVANQSPHKFAWLNGDSADFNGALQGRQVTSASHTGGFVELNCDHNRLIFSEGIKFLLINAGDKEPAKHQLLVRFTDESALACSVQMYGGMWYDQGDFDNEYYLMAKDKPEPLSPDFNYDYFQSIIGEEGLANKSVKEVLATKQRIPGLGNGILQDILFHGGIHSKRKMKTLTEDDKLRLYHALIETITAMIEGGGRDSEKGLDGNLGAYLTKVSKRTLGMPCQVCGNIIEKKAYMGGSIYYCPTCQPEIK